MSEGDARGLVADLRRAIGRSGPVGVARDPVNPAMIRHWCDAMQDYNPLYTNSEAAARSIHSGIVAPPAMLMAWSMRGLEPPAAGSAQTDDPGTGVYRGLDAAGFTSVVATDSEHEYPRYLRLGDELHSSQVLEDVSEEKKTALGVGHFVTTKTEYRDQHGEKVGQMLFRILKFKPGTGRNAGPGSLAGEAAAERPLRPEPGISRDTAFFWQGLEEGELRIQQCEGCSALHHPPMVRCPGCGSYALGWIRASGRGTVYSHVEPVHPRFSAFDPGYMVGLVELEEGTRLITNIVDVEPASVSPGMPVELVIRRDNSRRPLPLFRPVRPPRRQTTLGRGEVREGQELAPCPIPITATLIVSTAIASRDYQDVHHDRELAMQRGSPDIFMNILTTSGLCARYVTDWAGPEARVTRLAIRLGVPNYPHDTMTMTGGVRSVEGGAVAVDVRGYNRLGNHVTGTVELELPEQPGPCFE
ncbi:MAG: MaoC family dehydratase N-terminal domain-containing protein [Myxococcota bacterium]|nr:MaoC family dehydratase N-terminal domain-containing protein [Myxococcota bacterium]